MFRQRDLLCGVEGEFGQRYCGPCGVYFLSPRVPENRIERHYPETYGPHQRNTDPRLIRKAALAFGLEYRRRRIVERYVKRGNILDVGCGAGEFLELFGDGRWERYGTDVKEIASTRFKGTFHRCGFDRDRPPFLKKMDAITLWHVFEHLYHPRAALENASALLKPEGTLFLAIPDVRCFERLLFGRHWVGWDPPRHVATYSKKGIESLISAAGFRLVDVVPDGCSSGMLALNLEFVLRSFGIGARFSGSLILRTLLYPVVLASNALGLAPAKVYVIQK